MPYSFPSDLPNKVCILHPAELGNMVESPFPLSLAILDISISSLTSLSVPYERD